MNKSADIVIIGAGIIGCAIAYNLAKRGCKVIVIEKRERICSGASGANMGGVPLSLFSHQSPTLEMQRKSAKLYETLSEEISCDIEYQKVGLLNCIINEAQYPALKEHAEWLCRKVMDVKLIEGDEIRKQEPTLGIKIVAGIEDKETAVINPFKVTHGFARAAKKLGAEFFLATETQAIEVEKDKVTAVVTDKGRIRTNFVVNAAGVWSPEIGKMVGLNVPVEPIKGQAMVTEPMAPNQRWRYIMDADYITQGPRPSADSEDLNRKLGITGAWLQEKSGNWIVAASHESDFNTAVTMPTVSCLSKRTIEFMPRLKGAHFIRTWAGLRPHCYVDDLPILDKADSPSGFVIATGHLGMGVANAPITGKLIAELIIDNKTSLPIDAFSFSRFKNQARSL